MEMWSDVDGCRRWVARRRNSKVGYRARLRVCTPKVWLSVLCHLGCGGEEGVGRIMQKGSSRSGKAERRAMCQIKLDLNFVGGPHSGWQPLEKEDKMLGRLVLPLFCIRNIPSLKVQVETDFEFLFQLSAARENTPSTSRVPSIFEVGPTSVQYVQPRRNKKCICWVYSCMYSSKLPHYRI
jgi:hypothetical protein